MDTKDQLKKLREPFKPNQISKLPKPTKAQTDAVRADYRTGIRCTICGAWHHKDTIHLDYVGHAALTDRLLDVDIEWNWEPLTYTADGSPFVDKDGGMWIKLTVCGVTRLGYGDAQGKTGGDAMKERIGDALRNAAMRFGAALDLWHKGDLHVDDDANSAVGGDKAQVNKPGAKKQKPFIKQEVLNQYVEAIQKEDDLGFKQIWHEVDRRMQEVIWANLTTKEKEAARKLLDKEAA